MPAARRFLDANVLLRYFTRDDEPKAAHALALLLRVERREERVVTSPLVIAEVVFTLQKSYRVSRSRIRDLLTPIIALRGLQLYGKSAVERALDVYAASNISFVDAYTVALMEWRSVSEIYSWDSDFDRLRQIVRLEP